MVSVEENLRLFSDGNHVPIACCTICVLRNRLGGAVYYGHGCLWSSYGCDGDSGDFGYYSGAEAVMKWVLGILGWIVALFAIFYRPTKVATPQIEPDPRFMEEHEARMSKEKPTWDDVDELERRMRGD